MDSLELPRLRFGNLNLSFSLLSKVEMTHSIVLHTEIPVTSEDGIKPSLHEAPFITEV